MMGWFSRLFRGRDLKEVINQTKRVKVHGIIFHLKKLDPLSTLNGSKIMLQEYGVYELKGDKAPATQPNAEKIKSYYRDTFMAAVVSPKLYRDQEEAIKNDGIWVDGLFTDWDLVNGLYEQIVVYTYGKKKLKLSASREHTSSN